MINPSVQEETRSGMRQGLRSVLDGYSDVTVVGEAANGEEAVHATRELSPSVVIMEIHAEDEWD